MGTGFRGFPTLQLFSLSCKDSSFLIPMRVEKANMKFIMQYSLMHIYLKVSSTLFNAVYPQACVHRTLVFIKQLVIKFGYFEN